jgi:hypothetical protein
MPDLTPSQLESIRRLLLDPLREAVRAEIQLGHDRLASALDTLADHLHRTDKRITAVERDLTRLRTFRRRVLAVYSALAVLLSLIWSIVRDKVISLFASTR